MTHHDTHHTRLGGFKQDLQEFKSEFNSLLTDFSSKFENVNGRLNQLQENFKNNLEEQINEGIMCQGHYYQLPKMRQITTLNQGGSFGKEIK